MFVSPTGQIDPHPYARGFTAPTGMAFAPDGFGKYAADLFIADAGDYQIPAPMTQALKHDGIIYRVSSDGSPHQAAIGFINPIGVTFVDMHTLWITDINGDFIAGKRELPDGFVVKSDRTQLDGAKRLGRQRRRKPLLSATNCSSSAQVGQIGTIKEERSIGSS